MRFNLSSLVAAVMLAAVAVALYVPHHHRSSTAHRERQGAAAIAVIFSAQEDWRVADRDGNGASDYWSADIYGLYGLVGAAGPVHAIEESIAMADAQSRTADYVNLPPRGTGDSQFGYYFRAFENLPSTYETDVVPMDTRHDSRSWIRGSGSRCFEVLDFPASPGSIGCSRSG